MATAFYPLGMTSYSNRSKCEGYVSWKGSGEYANPTSITAGNIRPLTNNDPTNDTIYSHGIPRPIKHYRKGTITEPGRRSGRMTTISQAIERPGGFVQSTTKCNNNGGNTLVSNWSPIINLTQKPQVGEMPCNATNNQLLGGEVKKALNRVRPASTILKQNYFQTSAEHLYNRCSTFDQVESHYRPNLMDCGTKCENNSVYKPSNAKFAQQGAVSSSTRLLDLQRNAIEKGKHLQEPKQIPCIQYRRKR
jgi:hypothetical protein